MMKSKQIHYWFMLFIPCIALLLLLGACTAASQPDQDFARALALQETQIVHLSTEVAGQKEVDNSQWNALSYLSTQMPVALGQAEPLHAGITLTPTPFTEAELVRDPTDTPTPYLEGFTVHPPGRHTGVDEIDNIIDVVLFAGGALREDYIRYSTSPCTTADGLGGEPKCDPDEEEGTLVTAFPVSSGEGVHVRPERMAAVLSFEAQGLVAVYRVPDDAYERVYWPAGEYGLIFAVKEDHPVYLTVFVDEGWIVRLSYSYGMSPVGSLAPNTLFVLPPPEVGQGL